MNDENNNNKYEKVPVKVIDKRSWTKKHTSPDTIGNDAEVFDKRDLFPSYVNELEEKARKSELQLNEYIQAYKEIKKDQELFRQRMEKLKENDITEFKLKFFIKFIGILDDLSRAITAAKQNNSCADVASGIELVYSNILNILRSEEVEPISLQENKFDPRFCESIGVELTDDSEKDNLIAEIILPGYSYRDKVIRPAKVRIFRSHKPTKDI